MNFVLCQISAVLATKAILGFIDIYSVYGCPRYMYMYTHKVSRNCVVFMFRSDKRLTLI